jgi:hypothetical protein
VAVDDTEVIPKQLWMQSMARDVNLDEGKIFFKDSSKDQTASGSPHLQQIVQAAHEGSWVLVCPV